MAFVKTFGTEKDGIIKNVTEIKACVHVEKDNEYITSCGERFAFKCKYCPRCGKKVVNK